MSQPDAITIVITRTVRVGSEQAFEAALKHWIPQLLAFPGHLGVHMVRPFQDDREYGAVLKFSSQQEWQTFQQSAEYLDFQSEILPYLESEPQVETICGLESWFTPLGTRTTRVPPRWKMALVTWIGVCFTVYVVTRLFSPVTGQWPWFLSFITTNAGIVAGLTWCVMPILSRLFRAWLLP